MGPIWGRQDPGGPLLAPWTLLSGDAIFFSQRTYAYNVLTIGQGALVDIAGLLSWWPIFNTLRPGNMAAMHFRRWHFQVHFLETCHRTVLLEQKLQNKYGPLSFFDELNMSTINFAAVITLQFPKAIQNSWIWNRTSLSITPAKPQRNWLLSKPFNIGQIAERL